MDELVIGTLHEGRVYVAHRDKAFGCHPRGEGHSMFFCYAHIKGAIGVGLHHVGHGATCWHRWRNCHDAPIFTG